MTQVGLQPSPPTKLRSSHSSPSATESLPSPQKATSVHFCPGVSQVQPGSSVHVDVQPSPFAVLPSSQYSPKPRRPSPHFGMVTGAHGPPVPLGVGHVKPGSN